MIGPCLIAFIVTPQRYFDIEKAVDDLHDKAPKSPKFASQTGGTVEDNFDRKVQDKSRF